MPYCYLTEKIGIDSPLALITRKPLDGPNRWLKIQVIEMHTGHIYTQKASRTQILEQTAMIKDMTPATAEGFFYLTCNHIDKEDRNKKKAVAKALGLKKVTII